MKNKFYLFVVLLFVIVEFSNTYAQEFHFLQVDTSAFPTAKGWFFTRTKSGQPYANVQPSDFILTENGTAVSNFTIECAKQSTFPPVNVALLLDASSSLKDIASGKDTKMDWIKYFAKTILDTLKMNTGTQLQYLHFSSIVYQNSPWFNDWSSKQPLYDWIEQKEIIYAGATDFGHAFLDGNGGIEELKRTRYDVPRMLVFVSDGGPERTFTQATIDTIISRARQNKIVIFAITVAGTTDSDIRFICQETGGRTWSCFAKTEITTAIKELTGGDLQNKFLCNLVWASNHSCDQSTRNRSIFAKFSPIPDSTSTSFMAPFPPSITTSINQLMFGKGKTQQQLTLTAQGSDYSITEITASPNNKAYSIDLNGKTFPLTIAKGQNHTIKINYVDATATPQTSTLNFKGTPCPVPAVTLVAPCDGIATASVDCGKVLKNASKDNTFSCVFKNTTPVQITGTAALSGADAADFSIVSGGTFTLGTGQCVDMKIRFSPKAEGAKNAVVTLTLPTECGNKTFNVTGEGVLVGVEDSQEIQISLNQNSPNPFSDRTEIDFYTNGLQPIELSIYNSIGVKVETLFDNYTTSGLNRAIWNSVNYPSGIYMVKLQSGNTSVTKPIILAR